jgi:hypothetical protein
MQKIIIYINSDGQLVEVIPNLNCGLSIEQIALKDVPADTPFKIIDRQDIPSDLTFRDAWTMDMSSPDGYGADYGIGSEHAVDGWNANGTPIIRGEV